MASTPDDGACDNGLFCDGAETCDAVLDCQAGTAPDCDDGVACTADSCNEVTDSCDDTPNDAVCDNGVFCDGAEFCDTSLDCQAGAVPICDETGDVCISCAPKGASCSANSDCCSNKCRGKAGAMTCK